MIVLYVLLALIFWLIPLIWIFVSAETDYRQPTDRILWFMVVFFLPPIGGLVFLVSGSFASILVERSSISGGLAGGHYQSGDLKRAGDE